MGLWRTNKDKSKIPGQFLTGFAVLALGIVGVLRLLLPLQITIWSIDTRDVEDGYYSRVWVGPMDLIDVGDVEDGYVSKWVSAMGFKTIEKAHLLKSLRVNSVY